MAAGVAPFADDFIAAGGAVISGTAPLHGGSGNWTTQVGTSPWGGAGGGCYNNDNTTSRATSAVSIASVPSSAVAPVLYFAGIGWRPDATVASAVRCGWGFAPSGTLTYGASNWYPNQGIFIDYDGGSAGAATIRLFKDGALVSSFTTAQDAASGYFPVEVRFNRTTGAVEVWFDGASRLTTTASSTSVGQMVVGFATDALSTGSWRVQRLAVAGSPIAPGARRDTTEAESDTIPIAPIAAGANLPAVIMASPIGSPASDSNADLYGYTLVHDDATFYNSGDLAGSSVFVKYISNLFATDTGISTGAARCGQFRIGVFQKSTGGVNDWTIYSEGTGLVTPATFTNNGMPGYLNASTTVSSFTLPASLRAYPDTFSVGITLAHQPYRASEVPTIDLIQNTTTRHTAAGSAWASAASSTSDTMDEAYDAALDGVGVRFTLPRNSARSDPKFSFTSVPANWRNSENGTTHVVESSSTGSALTEDAFTVDPRLTASHLFQIDDDVFGTPPTSKNVTAKEMLTSQTGFMATRIVNARGEGQNGITVSQLMDPVLPGTDVGPTSGVTATQGGEAGWSPFLTWGSSKPGGTWNKTSDVTAPAAIDGNTYLLGATDAYTMLAVNPNFRVIVAGGVATGGQTGDHWHPGETMQVAGTLANFGTMDLLTSLNTAGKEPKCVIARFRDNGQVETLRADTYGSGLTAHVVTAATWVTLPDDSDPTTMGNLISLFNAESILGSAADGRVWLVQIASSVTATFDTHDLVVIARFYDSSGTPYSNSFVMDVLSSAANGHHTYKGDGAGFLGFPTR